jgi:glycosyltransferase involved in cell wall biosynthesis
MATWKEEVDRFIVLTDFSRDLFIKAGFPANKLSVKPHFCAAGLAEGKEFSTGRHGALFLGRLSAEKGIKTLIRVWEKIRIPLRVAGTGPLERSFSHAPDNVTFLGHLDRQEVSREMNRALFLVMPSEWYEIFGLVVIEAFAHGIPVLASDTGSLPDIVENGYSGLLFRSGDDNDLIRKVEWLGNNPIECRRMGRNAYDVYLEKFSPDNNYDRLQAIYQEARMESVRKYGRGCGQTFLE